MEATSIERATRYGSYVPVTTIGIAPIRTRDQRATTPPTHLQNAAHDVVVASVKADVGRRPEAITATTSTGFVRRQTRIDSAKKYYRPRIAIT
jgi:hypothetical protein